MRKFAIIGCACMGAVSGHAWSQSVASEADKAEVEGSIVAAVPTEQGTSARVDVPAGTPVTFAIADEVSSRTSRQGDRFSIRLLAPVVVEGKALIPIDTPGSGEVVHAARARAAGKAGELILAARYLEFRGVRVPLRRFHLGGRGADNSTGTAVLTVAGGVAGGIASLFISGGNMVVPPGTIGHAVVAADTDLPDEFDSPSAVDQAAP